MKRKNKAKSQISKFVLNFCKEVSSEKPVLVPLRPLHSYEINDCVNSVPEHIAKFGGEQILGWCIHIWKKVFIEAEFHSVWCSPDGELIDITPKVYDIDSIIFLPDNKLTYSGKQIRKTGDRLFMLDVPQSLVR